MNLPSVILAKAGIPLLASRRWSGTPAFVRVTALVMMAIALLFALPAAAQTFPDRGRSPVVDQAGLLRPEQVLDLTSKSEALYAATGRQFVVATIKSLEGRTIEDYGYRLLRHWQLGDKERDDGVILIVAPAEHKVRIETGYGARVFLTDAVSSVIIRESIVPRFKAGDMGGGVVAGADAIISTMQLPAAEAAKRAKEVGAKEARRGRAGGAGFVPVIFIVIIFFMIVGGIARAGGGGKRYRSRRGGGIDPLVVLWGLQALSQASRGGGGGWGGGGGFGGFGGGGGGGFGGFSGGGGSGGGGGASGSW